MPCTTIELGDAQIEPGKPRYPLNAGSPPCERMNFSAASSSSAVVTPARAFPARSVWHRASTRPAAAIISIPAGARPGRDVVPPSEQAAGARHHLDLLWGLADDPRPPSVVAPPRARLPS